MTGGISKGQIVAGCIGLVLLLGIGYWAIKRPDDSSRKKRGKSKKKVQKDVVKNKSKKQRKRKYSDSESNSSESSIPESSELNSSSDQSDSQSDSIDVAPKHRRTSRKEPSRSGKIKKSNKNPNLKLKTSEPAPFETQALPSTKRSNPLKIESVLMEKKKPENQESSQFARS